MFDSLEQLIGGRGVDKYLNGNGSIKFDFDDVVDAILRAVSPPHHR